MESKKLTITLAIILTTGGIYYGYSEYYSPSTETSQVDDLADIEDPNTSQAQAETDEGATLDQNTSEEGDTITTDREIKGRNNTQTDTERQGITITTDNIVAGEPVRVTVYTEEGERLEEEPVYVNGNQVGETRHTGALVFEAPNTDEITVGAADFESVTRTVRQNDTEQTETSENPEISLEYPDRETVETLNDETNIVFEYSVGDRANAEQTTITLENDEGEEIDSHTRATDSHTTFKYEFENLAASQEGETYIWSISTEQNEVKESTSFDLEIVDPEADLELVDETELADGEVEFDYYADSDVEAEIEIEVLADEKMERTWAQCNYDNEELEEETISYEDGEKSTEFSIDILGGQTLDTEFNKTLKISGDYRWEGGIRNEEGILLDSARSQTFTVTDQPAEDTEDRC